MRAAFSSIGAWFPGRSLERRRRGIFLGGSTIAKHRRRLHRPQPFFVVCFAGQPVPTAGARRARTHRYKRTLRFGTKWQLFGHGSSANLARALEAAEPCFTGVYTAKRRSGKVCHSGTSCATLNSACLDTLNQGPTSEGRENDAGSRGHSLRLSATAAAKREHPAWTASRWVPVSAARKSPQASGVGSSARSESGSPRVGSGTPQNPSFA
jgi:hypothetical protein